MEKNLNIDDENNININFNDSFKLPIYYNEKKMVLNNNIVTDLELKNTINNSCVPIYNYYFTYLYYILYGSSKYNNNNGSSKYV